ncbi:MAG: hypothetical protein WEC75_14855 [Dehalococcoidia bacterium]
MRRPLVVAIVCALAVAASACGGDEDAASAPTRLAPRATATAPAAPAGTPRVLATPDTDVVEVTGIVGVVDTSTRIIEINRTAGASVRRVEVLPDTVISSADGTRVSFADIRPSDRIIARGRLDEAGDVLVADDIGLSRVIGGGGAPGG